LIRTLPGHAGGTLSVAFSPDGQFIASGGRDTKVRKWRVSDGALMAVFNGHGNWVWSVAFAPGGATIASGSYDATIKIWDFATTGLIRTLGNGSFAVLSIAYSPDGQSIVSGGEAYGNNVQLWRVSDGVLLLTLPGDPDGFVESVAFAPTGQAFFTASGYTFKIQAWRASDGALLRTYDRETGWGPFPVLPLTISPNDRLFGFGRSDATVIMARNPLAADFDLDGDVDLADWSPLSACLTGPATAAPPACASQDLDADADVDLFDAASFQRAFSGAL
jgi:WD40 repeat protein